MGKKKGNYADTMIRLCTLYLEQMEEKAVEDKEEEFVEVTPTVKIPKTLAVALANTSIQCAKKGRIQNVFDGICSDLLFKGMHAILITLADKVMDEIEEDTPTKDCDCPFCTTIKDNTK